MMLHHKIQSFVVLLILSTGLFATTVHAHTPGQSSIRMKLMETAIAGEIKIYYGDLQPLLSELRDMPTPTDAAALHPYATVIDRYIHENVIFYMQDNVSTLRPKILGLPTLNPDGTISLQFQLHPIDSTAASLRITQQGFFDKNPQFTSLVTLTVGSKIKKIILTKSRNTSELFINPGTEFIAFFRYGLEHIFLGLDHIFFIILLILHPFLADKHQTIRTNFSKILWVLIKLATAFTIAHSLTLLFAILNWSYFPADLVEIIIVASIVFVGLHNLIHFNITHEWILVFLFGLFHGYGFSTALKGLGLSRGNLAVPLGGFNLGIEAGQILIIMATLLPLYFMGLRWSKSIKFLRMLCLLLTGIASCWLLKRIVEFL